jgi:hypothetical protein
MNLSVGISGTRRGMIDPQKRAFRETLLSVGLTELHHGDCIGVDAEAHHECRALLSHAKIVVHPPKNPKNRAWCKGDVVLPEKDYFQRNIDIVTASTLLIACPKMMSEEYRGSGTWHAIRTARRLNVKTLIIWPTGQTLVWTAGEIPK